MFRLLTKPFRMSWTALFVTACLLFIGGRVTQLGWRKHVAPRLTWPAFTERVRGWFRDGPEETTALGHEVMAELRRPNRWRLMSNDEGGPWGLVHVPDEKLEIRLRTHRHGRASRPEVRFKSRRVENELFSDKDLKELTRMGEQVAIQLREQSLASSQAELRGLFQSENTKGEKP